MIHDYSNQGQEPCLDMSVEIDALRTLEKSGKVRPELARKILYDNPARFYGIQ
jgi:hypothetical protein